MSLKKFYMKNKKPLVAVFILVIVLAAYVLNGNTFKNLWNNLTASLGGYGRSTLSDTRTIEYTKKLYDTTGAIFDTVKTSKTFKKSDVVVEMNGDMYTKEEVA